MGKHVLSVLVRNNSGVLSRVTGLFSRRGFNIDSLSVSVTECTDISRMTLVTSEDGLVIDQIIKQLEKLHDVLHIEELDMTTSVFRELLLVKVSAISEHRAAIVEVADIFRAKIVDVSGKSLIIELTGGQSKLDAFMELLEPYGIKEFTRTGLTALQRGGGAFTEGMKDTE